MKPKGARKRGTVGGSVIRALREAVAIERGERVPLLVRVYARDARMVLVRESRAWSGREVARLRGDLGFSQAVFARVLNVSPSTVRAWEQGVREPDGPALRLLDILRRQPELATDLVAPKVRAG